MLKLALACEKDKEATASFYLVKDKHGITLKAKDVYGGDWYIASIGEDGMMELHQSVPFHLGLILNGDKHDCISVKDESDDSDE